ncbi:MAG: putative colanic acid biosynthesis acetyltransferase [Phycisphaerae bacterium]|nr:putative colanic acid biosynthesis acetyltransferase [Phycisphaerae bacterium]
MDVAAIPDPRHGKRPSPHSLKNRLARMSWGLVQSTLFRWSPRPLFKIRVALLKAFGAEVTWKSRPYPRCKIWGPWNLSMEDFATLADDVDCYCVERIHIGERTTVSQYAYLCGATHDHEDPGFKLIPRPITIGKHCWIAADVFVAPGVTIGDGSVVGARSSVFTPMPEWSVCVGTPAKVVGPRNLRGSTGSLTTESTESAETDTENVS